MALAVASLSLAVPLKSTCAADAVVAGQHMLPTVTALHGGWHGGVFLQLLQGSFHGRKMQHRQLLLSHCSHIIELTQLGGLL